MERIEILASDSVEREMEAGESEDRESGKLERRDIWNMYRYGRYRDGIEI